MLLLQIPIHSHIMWAKATIIEPLREIQSMALLYLHLHTNGDGIKRQCQWISIEPPPPTAATTGNERFVCTGNLFILFLFHSVDLGTIYTNRAVFKLGFIRCNNLYNIKLMLT